MSSDSGLQTNEIPARADSQSEYTPRRFRYLFPPPRNLEALERACDALWPWSRNEYPGKQRLRAWLLGVSVQTGNAYRKLATLPKIRRVFLADRLRAKASELLALADEISEGLKSGPVKAPSAVSKNVRKVAPPR